MPLLRSSGPHTSVRAIVAAAGVALLLSGCGGKTPSATQVVAKVNQDEISVHQINHVLQQQRGIKPEQTDAASREILERLIDQQLLIQKAQELKLDREPAVMQSIESAKRDILARAYVDRASEAVTAPSADEVRSYYDAKPALFKERRIYTLQSLSIDAKPEQYDELRRRLESSRNIAEFGDYLRSRSIRFSEEQLVRPAESVPMAQLETLATMSEGQMRFNAGSEGAQVVALSSAKSEPISLEQARPAIEQYLMNQRRRELVTKDIKGLRSAAKVEYVGKFAQGAPASPSVTAAEAPVAGTLDAATVNKGMGIK